MKKIVFSKPYNPYHDQLLDIQSQPKGRLTSPILLQHIESSTILTVGRYGWYGYPKRSMNLHPRHACAPAVVCTVGTISLNLKILEVFISRLARPLLVRAVPWYSPCGSP